YRLRLLPPLSPGAPLLPCATLFRSRMDEHGFVPIAVDVESGRERRLLAEADSFARADLGGTLEDVRGLSSVGRWIGGFLIANGRRYRIGGYDWEGRLRFVIAPDVPP